MHKLEEVMVNFKEKKKKIKVRKLSLLGMLRGLMFRDKNFNECLFFKFRREYGYSIHSLFVFFDFYALWLDDKNKVREVQKVKPFRLLIKPKKPFYRLIEIPANNHNKKLIEFFVGKRKI